MFFESHFTVPANTTETAPYTEHIKLKHGVIHYVEAIPWGYAVDILQARVELGLHSIFPTDGSDHISFGGHPVAGKVHQLIATPPYEVTALAWNSSTLYSHSFTLRLWMLPEELLMPTPKVWQEFRAWFERLIRGGR